MRLATLALFVVIVGCASPARSVGTSYFDRAWRQDPRNAAVQSLASYRAWVALFYEGSALLPGWTRRQDELCASVDPATARLAEPLLECLGRLLSSEWAKDNRMRLIESNHLQIWAACLNAALDEGRLIEGLDVVLADVRVLLSGDLSGAEVTGERYARLDALR